MEEALRALLIGYAPLTALVSQRIYWNAIPQDAADPCVVLYKISGGEGHHLQGPDGLFSGTVQIDVRAVTVSSMWAISRAIRAKLDGYSDANFRGVFHRNDRQSSEKPGTVLYHRSSQDFDVFYSA
jgi:hypothetical protein